ncbi:truncated hemoglobin [Streptomyces cyaneofuscatus]|uniref:truncated hemoglobin n=1 Tax=Streptomyces cyaneofuscatus TaxID=66883 RepID=UPI003651CB7A
MSGQERQVHISAEAQHLVLATSDPQEVRDGVIEWYRSIGGRPFFDRLCDAFYGLVAEDDLLGPLFDDRWDVHARRLADHFHQMYGVGDLGQAWGSRLLRVHSTFLISHSHRRRWIDLFTEAGRRIDAPEPLFSELVGIMLIAAGDLMAASRGAALERGEKFDTQGRPLT